MNTLTKLQKRALRTVELTRFNSHTDPIFHKHRILKFQDLLQMEQIVWVYKSRMGIFPDHITQQLLTSSATTELSLRSQSTKMLPRNCKETQLVTTLKRAWNNLDELSQNTNVLSELKFNIRSMMISTYSQECTSKPQCPICEQQSPWGPIVPAEEEVKV